VCVCVREREREREREYLSLRKILSLSLSQIIYTHTHVHIYGTEKVGFREIGHGSSEAVTRKSLLDPNSRVVDPNSGGVAVF
jgi:hypothetical protein